MSSHLRSLISPFFALFAAVVTSVYISATPPLFTDALPWLPYILLVFVAFMAWHFNQGRVFLIAVLSLAHLATPSQLALDLTTDRQSIPYIPTLFCFLLLALFTEKGCANRFTLNRFMFFVVCYAWWFAFVKGWVALPGFLKWLMTEWQGMVLSDLLPLTFCTAVVALVWLRRGNHYSAALLVSVFCVLLPKGLAISHLQQNLIWLALGWIWLWFLLSESRALAYRDELTQLPSRRALNDALVALPQHYAIAMLDVDHFKKFNDSYGHDMGDEVLKMVGATLKMESCGALPYRYGGEEFTLLFKGKRVDEAGETLEHIREAIASTQVQIVDAKGKEKSVGVTVSLGWAESNTGASPEIVIKAADESLYKAKKKGRNCIVKASK